MNRRLVTVVVILLVTSMAWAESRDRGFPAPLADPVNQPETDTIVLAGGCFWGMEAVFESLKGVDQVVSGYAGGAASTATYRQVSTGKTGHAEAVEIHYRPSVIPLGVVLEVYFSVAHDPTDVDGQGPDRGSQYRSVIFSKDLRQSTYGRAYLRKLQASGYFPQALATKIEDLKGFYPAEDEHQDYLKDHLTQPYIVFWDLPKLRALARVFPDWLKAGAKTFPELWFGYSVREPREPVFFPIMHTDAEWKSALAPQRYTVLREEATERPFTGDSWAEHRSGTYYSAATGQPLFRSQDKFDSATGWPSFTKPVSPTSVVLRRHLSLGMERIEVEDSSSGSHLGHVFDDGPSKTDGGTGLRFCMNSASLIFVAEGAPKPEIVRVWESSLNNSAVR